MRSMLLTLFLGCALAAAVAAPGVACDYHATTASDQAAAQHTAEAQSSTQSDSN